MQKAHAHLEHEIACISLNPPSNQPLSVAGAVATAMESEEGSKLDALVAVGMWTDMTVSSGIRKCIRGIHIMTRQRYNCCSDILLGEMFWFEYSM